MAYTVCSQPMPVPPPRPDARASLHSGGGQQEDTEYQPDFNASWRTPEGLSFVSRTLFLAQTVFLLR